MIAPTCDQDVDQKPARGSRARAWAPFAALALLFVAVRIILIFLTGVMEVDSVRYITLGRFWASGDFRAALDTEYHPLYPLLLGFFIAPFADPELPARLLSLLLSAATMVPLAWMGWMIGGRKTALATLFVFALLPFPWRFSIQIISEPLALLLVCWQCAFVLRLFRDWNWRFAVAAGLCGGAAYLVRPEAFLPLLALAPVALLPGFGAPSFPRRLAVAACAVPAFLLLAAPYMLLIGGFTAKKRVARLAGSGAYSHQEPKWFSINDANPDAHPEQDPGKAGSPDASARNGNGSVDPTSPGTGSGSAAQGARAARVNGSHRPPDLSAWEFSGTDPDHVARAEPVDNPLWVALWHFLMAGHFISPFYVLAGFMLSRIARRPWRPDLFLAVLAAGNFAMVMALLLAYRYMSMRHVMPATLATIPMAALGAVELWRVAGLKRPWIGRGVFLLCATAFVLFFFCQGFRPLRYPKRVMKIAASVLRERTSADDILLSDDVRYSFYSGRGFLGLGMMDKARLDRVARERGVRIIVVERRELERRVPGFAESAAELGWLELDLRIPAGSTFVPVAYVRSP